MTTTTTTKVRLKWDGDETVHEGKRYGWSGSDTPSLWVDGEGWKPLVWTSYHGLSASARRRLLRELILSQD